MTYENQVLNALNRLKNEKYQQTFVLQKVNDGITFANSSRLLLTSPSPSNLDKDVTLNYINQSNISQVAETLQIDETWVSPIFNFNIRDGGKAVVRLGLMNKSTNSSSVIDTTLFTLGTVNSAGTFSGIHNATATFDYSNNNTTFLYSTHQAIFENISINCDTSNYLALRTRIYSHANNSNVLSTLRLETNRGSYDSYLILSVNPK